MDWFRFYTETIHDRKIRRLSPAQRWLWVTVLSIARSSPEPGRLLISEGVPVVPSDLVDAAAVSRKDVKAGLEAFIEQHMLHLDGDVYVVSHWDDRQFTADDSKDRVRRYRQRKRNADVTLHDRYSNDDVTPPDPDHRLQITERDQRADVDPRASSDVVKVLQRQVPAGLPRGYEHDIMQCVKLGVQPDLVDKAFVVAKERKATNLGSYVRSILQGCVNYRIFTAAQFETLEAEREVVAAGRSQNARATTTTSKQKDERYTAFYALFPDT